MAIYLIDKIKPKNSGTFAMVDSADVEMSDGTRLEEFLQALAESTGALDIDYEANLAFDTGELVVGVVDDTEDDTGSEDSGGDTGGDTGSGDDTGDAGDAGDDTGSDDTGDTDDGTETTPAILGVAILGRTILGKT